MRVASSQQILQNTLRKNPKNKIRKSQNWRQNAQQAKEENPQSKNPYFQKNQKDKNDQQNPNSSKQRFNNQKSQGRGPEPMEVDSSSRFNHTGLQDQSKLRPF